MQKISALPVIAIFFLVLLATPIYANTGGSSAVLNQLNSKVANEKNPGKKAKLCMYRARYFVKNKQFDLAVRDYNQAMKLDHKSWIHLERAKLLLAMKKYNLAREDASAAKEENPKLCLQADPIIEKANNNLKIQNNQKNPEKIVLDREVNPYKKSRFDLARELGLDNRSGSFLIPRQKKNSSVKKTASRSNSPSKPRRS